MRKIAVLCLIAAASVVGADVNKLATECGAGKPKSCVKLVETAKTDKKSEVRQAAVEKINDALVLTEIARTDPATNVRTAAVKKLSDEATLADVARTDKDARVRIEAARRVNDQAALAAIAKACRASTEATTDHEETALRDLVLARISDPEMLLGLVKTTAGSTPTRAMERLAKLSPSLVVSTAKDPAGGAPAAAVAFGVQSLDEPDLLSDVAHGAHAPLVRAAAVRRLPDQEVLEAFARSDREPLVRAAALQTLKDSALVEKIRAVEADADVRCAAAPPILFLAPDPYWESVELNGSSVRIVFGLGDVAIPLSEGDQHLRLRFSGRRQFFEAGQLVQETTTATDEKTFSAARGDAFRLYLSPSLGANLSSTRLVPGRSGDKPCIPEQRRE